MPTITLTQNPIATLDQVADNPQFGRFTLLKSSNISAVSKPKYFRPQPENNLCTYYFTVRTEAGMEYQVSFSPVEKSLLDEVELTIEKVRVNLCQWVANKHHEFICIGRGKLAVA